MPQNPGDNPTGEIGLLALEETGENIHASSRLALPRSFPSIPQLLLTSTNNHLSLLLLQQA
jgi:hypothetical protein